MRLSHRTLLVAVLIVAAACARRGGYTSNEPGGDDASQTRTATLHVENNNVNDVIVYAVGEGMEPRRLGLVTAVSRADFTLSPEIFLTGQLEIIGRPLASSSVARSGPLTVSAGREVTFRIEINLAASMATVR
ncbi:MAG: hypothetical protein ABJD07_14470 [Gemmatimonadaceae bacterium]